MRTKTKPLKVRNPARASEQTLYELAFIINRAYAHELMFTEDVQKQKTKLVAIWSTLLRDPSAQHSAFRRISLENQVRGLELTVLAVNAAEAWWTLADVTDEGIAPVGLADVAYSSVMTRVWMARTCTEEEEKWDTIQNALLYYCV